MMDASYGTEEADIFSSIAVGVSSFVTILVLALGVILMIPLQPILETPVVQTATAYILPALFGTLIVSMMDSRLGSGITSPNKIKGVILLFLGTLLIAVLDQYVFHIGIMSRYQGLVVLVLLPSLYFGTKFLYDKGQNDVYLPGEK